MTASGMGTMAASSSAVMLRPDHFIFVVCFEAGIAANQ